MLQTDRLTTTTGRLRRTAALYDAPSLSKQQMDSLRWLVSVRGKVGLGLFALLVAFLFVPGVPLTNTLALIALDSVILAVNVVYTRLLKPDSRLSGRTVAAMREVLIPIDAVLCTVAIYFSGGVLTPVFIVYSVGILMSIMMLDGRGVIRTAALSVLLYSGLMVLEAYQGLPYTGGYWNGAPPPGHAAFVNYAMYLLLVSSMLMVAAYIGNRIAVLINRRRQQVDSQLGDLQTLYDVASKLANIMEEEHIARYLAETLHKLQGTSRSVVRTINADGSPAAMAMVGLEADEFARLRGAARQTPILLAALERGEPLVIDDVNVDESYTLLTSGLGEGSLYIYPIMAEGVLVAWISLHFGQINGLNSEQKNLMRAISSPAGMAIQRARLFCDTQRLAREMSALYDFGLYTSSTLSTAEVVKRTSDNIEKLLKPDMYYIALYDAGAGMLSFEVLNESGEMLEPLKVPLDPSEEGLTGYIIRTGKALLVSDWEADGEEYDSIVQLTGDESSSYLGVPMIFNGKTIGVISVQSKKAKAFGKHDQGVLEAMAAQTAIALENAGLHQLAQEGAITDSLTQVYNHGHFVELVEQAVKASDQDDSQVSLAMLDIDHFKAYNDTYGHVAGDNVLRLVAQAIKASVRECDAVGRWGGEEFGVLMTGLGPQDAKKMTRTIRRAVAEIAPLDGSDRKTSSPTISQGISTYPCPSVSAAHLIEEADAALYHAKTHGRNQIVLYEATGVFQETRPTTSPLVGAATITMKDVSTRTTAHLEE